jgi:putative spermidine/putrescine transport system permease protein
LILGNVVGYAILLLPLVIVVVISFTSGAGVDFPPPGYSLRWFEYIAQRPEFVSGTVNSLVLAVVATVLALVLGILASFGLVRYRFRGKGVVEALFLAPLVVPSLIIGVSLVYFFSTIGFRDSFQRLVLAHLILTVPYTIRSVSATLYGIDPAYEEVSRVMGAGAWRTFRSVVLPLTFPAIVAGSIFTFALSLGDYITVKIVGGSTQMAANVIYDNIGVAGNLPFAAAAAFFPVGVIVVYLVLVRRTGALDNL